MKPFTKLAVGVFSLVGLAHLLRLAMGVEVVIAGREIPMWASVIGAAFAGLLALMLAREARGTG